MTRRGMTLLELLVGAAIGLGSLAAVVGLMTLYRKPADRRERVRAASVSLALTMERIVRSVRDAASVEEAAGPTLLLRTPEGTVDLYHFRPAADGRPGELVLIEDAARPQAAGGAVETVLASQLARASFLPTDAGLTLLPLPAQLGPIAQDGADTVACALELTVEGQPVRVATSASCRNGRWGALLR